MNDANSDLQNVTENQHINTPNAEMDTNALISASPPSSMHLTTSLDSPTHKNSHTASPMQHTIESPKYVNHAESDESQDYISTPFHLDAPQDTHVSPQINDFQEVEVSGYVGDAPPTDAEEQLVHHMSQKQKQLQRERMSLRAHHQQGAERSPQQENGHSQQPPRGVLRNISKGDLEVGADEDNNTTATTLNDIRITIDEHQHNADENRYVMKSPRARGSTETAQLTEDSNDAATSPSNGEEIDQRPSFRKSTMASSSKKRKGPNAKMPNLNRFSLQSPKSNGALIGKEEFLEAERQRIDRIERMKRAKDQATKLNRFSAKYLKRGSQTHVDVVRLIEEKVEAMIKGFVVRWRLERQILAAVRIQRFVRETRPMWLKWKQYWNKVWEARVAAYTMIQSHYRAQEPFEAFQNTRESIILLQSGVRTILVQENPLNQYAYVKEKVGNAADILDSARFEIALESKVKQIKFVQNELAGALYLKEMGRKAKSRAAKGCCTVM